MDRFAALVVTPAVAADQLRVPGGLRGEQLPRGRAGPAAQRDLRDLGGAAPRARGALLPARGHPQLHVRGAAVLTALCAVISNTPLAVPAALPRLQAREAQRARPRQTLRPPADQTQPVPGELVLSCTVMSSCHYL